jgi:hypothetical protein
MCFPFSVPTSAANALPASGAVDFAMGRPAEPKSSHDVDGAIDTGRRLEVHGKGEATLTGYDVRLSRGRDRCLAGATRGATRQGRQGAGLGQASKAEHAPVFALLEGVFIERPPVLGRRSAAEKNRGRREAVSRHRPALTDLTAILSRRPCGDVCVSALCDKAPWLQYAKFCTDER